MLNEFAYFEPVVVESKPDKPDDEIVTNMWSYEMQDHELATLVEPQK